STAGVADGPLALQTRKASRGPDAVETSAKQYSLGSVNAFQIGRKRKQKLIGPIDRICPARATVQMPGRQRVACMLGATDCAKLHVAGDVRVLLHRRR